MLPPTRAAVRRSTPAALCLPRRLKQPATGQLHPFDRETSIIRCANTFDKCVSPRPKSCSKRQPWFFRGSRSRFRSCQPAGRPHTCRRTSAPSRSSAPRRVRDPREASPPPVRKRLQKRSPPSLSSRRSRGRRPASRAVAAAAVPGLDPARRDATRRRTAASLASLALVPHESGRSFIGSRARLRDAVVRGATLLVLPWCSRRSFRLWNLPRLTTSSVQRAGLPPCRPKGRAPRRTVHSRLPPDRRRSR